jgi:hypothetical protein
MVVDRTRRHDRQVLLMEIGDAHALSSFLELLAAFTIASSSARGFNYLGELNPSTVWHHPKKRML